MAADRIHLASPAPPHCSSCFGAYPSRPHVDFGATYDGPVLGEGVTMHVIDDLVICEDCLVTAGKLIGLGDVVAVTAEMHRLEHENDDRLQEIIELRNYVERLEAVRDGRPAMLAPTSPRKPSKAKLKADAVLS